MRCCLQVLTGSSPPLALAPRLEALPAALGISPEEVLALVHNAPYLLLLPTTTISAGWRQLKKAAGMRPEWKEQIGGWGVLSVLR